MPKKPSAVEPGMTFVHESGRRMVVKEVTRDAVYVEVDRIVRGRDGEPKVEQRRREIPRNVWPHVWPRYASET